MKEWGKKVKRRWAENNENEERKGEIEKEKDQLDEGGIHGT